LFMVISLGFQVSSVELTVSSLHAKKVPIATLDLKYRWAMDSIADPFMNRTRRFGYGFDHAAVTACNHPAFSRHPAEMRFRTV
jgi:hypothetical protein